MKPDLLQEIENFLKQENFVCETASTFFAADETLSLYNYDIAVVDIGLPDGRGLQLIEKLKNKHSDTGIIIISAKTHSMIN